MQAITEYEPVGRFPITLALTPGEIRPIPEFAFCENCGTHGGQPDWSVVIDWRTDYLCPKCVASFDWSDWWHVGNLYQHK
jgi:hypothetical protein